MVEWKGRLDSDAGQKARNLDSIENFPVPNFFVITSSESSAIFEGKRSSEEILNTDVNSGYKEQIKDAYEDIGMSSEVRNANGKAKNLVGGQRNNQLVSVRVSDKGHGYKYKLNVGASDLLDAIKEVTASYYEKESSYPSIIVQKMVEPEYSGSVVPGDYENPGLLEVVEGLGVSLEEGENRPYIYIKDGDSIDSRKPSEHKKVSRNPINGSQREKKVEPELPFKDSEVDEMFEKLNSEDMNIKFVYKRGDFHVVDAWDEEPKYEVLKDSDIQGLKVSEGQINGEVGREILYTEHTVPPEKYQNALIARQGGYTSRDAEKAREAGKPAVFSFTQELKNGQRINMAESKDNTRDRRTGSTAGRPRPSERSTSFGPDTGSNKATSSPGNMESMVAAETLPLNPREGEGVFTSPPYGDGYALTDRNAGDDQIPREGYIDSYERAFKFDGDSLVLDTRKLGDSVEPVIDYLDADLKIIIVEKPDIELLVKAVENGFDVYSSEDRYIEDLRSKLARAEKKFMLDELR